MSSNLPTGSDWIFYGIGILFLVLGVLFFLIPLLSRAINLSAIKIPWIILYVYKSDGFYFATSPLLLILSAVAILYYIFRR